MSDIPLRSFRRNQTRSNYIPLADNDIEAGNRPSVSRISDKETDMPSTGITKAAVTSSTARRSGKVKGKGRDRYVDDPEEEERLLGGSFDDTEESAETEGQGPSPTKVRF